MSNEADLSVPARDAAALDAYSQTVIAVAASVTPHVASVRMPGAGGSAVVFSDEQAFCYRYENGKAVRTPVQVGIHDGQHRALFRRPG